MKIWFLKRGYPDKIFENKMDKVNFGESRSKTKSAMGVPFIVAYHHKLKALGKIIHENLNLLYMNDEVKDTFTPEPIFSFRTVEKLSSYLVRTKLYPLGRTVGFKKCSEKRCKVWENIQNSNTSRSSGTSETFKINHQLTCDDKCLVYLFTSKTCSKQCTGETGDLCRLKCNNYKSNDRKFKRGEHCMQEHLYEHFYSDSHSGFIDDVTIMLTDKADGEDPKNTESYGMTILKVLAPDGLNIKDCLTDCLYIPHIIHKRFLVV